MIYFLYFLLSEKCSYSVINTAKSMLWQTLPFFGVDLCNFRFIERMMKGCFNSNPPRVRYCFMWDVGIVLKFLEKLYPLESLSLKMLTLKLITLVALTTAARAQTLSALDLNNMKIFEGGNKVVFGISQLLKTSRPGRSSTHVILRKFDREELCVVKTLLRYVEVSKDLRKSSMLFMSYMTHQTVTTSTLSRWLKTVLCLSGIDTSVFKAHSVRGASTSSAFMAGCSIQNIQRTANWSNAKTFHMYYNKVVDSNIDFASAVLNQV